MQATKIIKTTIKAARIMAWRLLVMVALTNEQGSTVQVLGPVLVMHQGWAPRFLGKGGLLVV